MCGRCTTAEFDPRDGVDRTGAIGRPAGTTVTAAVVVVSARDDVSATNAGGADRVGVVAAGGETTVVTAGTLGAGAGVETVGAGTLGTGTVGTTSVRAVVTGSETVGNTFVGTGSDGRSALDANVTAHASPVVPANPPTRSHLAQRRMLL